MGADDRTDRSGAPRESGGHGGGAAAADPTHEAIARRAHAIWEAAGRPEGADWEHWFQAERELTTSPFASRTPPR